MLVKDIMKSGVECCHVDANLETVANLMWNNDCGAIPVVDHDGKPVGIVTDRDIAMGCALNHRPLWDMRAGDIANGRPLYVCTEEDELESALTLMRDHQIRRLPVADANGRLCGIIAAGDLINQAQKRPRNGDKVSYDQVVSTLKAVSQPYRPEAMVQAG